MQSVRRPVKLIPPIAIVAFMLSAFAGPAQWVEVGPGAWRPQTTDLVAAEVALRPAVKAAAKNRGPLPPWPTYIFQYQGRRTLLGKRYIYVNAFCDGEAHHELKVWVEVMDGGACYFRGKYDTEEHRLYDLLVNGVA